MNQDEDHLLWHCTAQNFVTIRAKLQSDADTLINSYPNSLTPCRQFARAIRDLALSHPDGTSIWTGLWRDSVLNFIAKEAQYGPPSLTYTDACALKNVLNEVGKYFCYATNTCP